MLLTFLSLECECMLRGAKVIVCLGSQKTLGMALVDTILLGDLTVQSSEHFAEGKLHGTDFSRILNKPDETLQKILHKKPNCNVNEITK